MNKLPFGVSLAGECSRSTVKDCACFQQKGIIDASETTRFERRAGAVDLVGNHGLVVEEFARFTAIGKVWRNFAVPLGVWGIALLLAGHASLPASLVGLKNHGPTLIFACAVMLSLAFRRGRAFFVLCCLALAHFAYVFLIEQEPAGFAAQTAYAALCIFVPLDIAVFTMLRERGALNAPGLRRLSLPLIQIGASIAVVLSDATNVTEALYRPIYEPASFAGLHIPQLGIICTAATVIITVVYAVVRGSVVDAAFATAAASFALACNDFPSPGTFVWFCTTAGAVVAIAVVQDSYRMAFYDELTGLPGRRALNERLAALEGNFTVAMVDIDHFKAFNDTWGHDVGDQVLKLVAARLQRVGAGGRAYRYGGEEFTIVFSGKRAISLRYHLEALRKDIETYRLMIRESGLSRNAMRRRDPAGALATSVKWISVTISMGVAERADRLDAPERALEAADQALYRAKEEGRNRVVGP